jgi:preprotein translocase subunit SecD
LKAFSWKLASLILVMVVSVIYIMPTVSMYAKHQNKPELWPKKKINLGLDLQGGMYLLLEVKSEKAVENNLDNRLNDMKRNLFKNGVQPKALTRMENSDVLLLQTDSGEPAAKFEALVKKEYPEFEIKSKTGDTVTTDYQFAYKQEESERIKKAAIDQSLETLRNRIDQFGVAEPEIRRLGENRIQVQLPGIKDPKGAKKLIGQTAVLQFRLVDEDHDVQSAMDGNAPPGTEVLYETEKDPVTDAVISKKPYLIKKEVLLTGEALSDARLSFDNMNNDYYVSIDFNSAGGRAFAEITDRFTHKKLAIVLDNNVYSAPVIQNKIVGGHAMITGRFTQESGKVLAIALRAGALPAPVEFLEERTVGPALGMDAIKKGVISMVIGTAIVFLFMAVYYKQAGLIANVTLFMNIIIMAAALAMVQATLTLPGIAGFVLTIGMAVDAHVLIFERTREEVRAGKSPIAAVAAGFERAVLTIIDSNVTTLIAAVVLYQYGTGPVKGFAVTLSIGIVASLFTSLIVCEMLMDAVVKRSNSKTLSI